MKATDSQRQRFITQSRNNMDCARSVRMRRFLTEVSVLFAGKYDVLRRVGWMVYHRDSTFTVEEDGTLSGAFKRYGELHPCRLSPTGHFCCTDSHARLCSRIHKGPCKHLLAWVILAVLDKHLSSADALARLKSAMRRVSDTDKKPMMPILLAPLVAGELDWRPNVPVPEDHYAL